MKKSLRNTNLSTIRAIIKDAAFCIYPCFKHTLNGSGMSMEKPSGRRRLRCCQNQKPTVKKVTQYFQWLSQGNPLIFSPEKPQNQLVFEGKSCILWKIILNSLFSLLTMFLLLVVIIVFDLRNLVTIILTVIISLL